MRKLITTALVALLMLAGCVGTKELEPIPNAVPNACAVAFEEAEYIMEELTSLVDLLDMDIHQQIKLLEDLIDMVENSDYMDYKSLCLAG